MKSARRLPCGDSLRTRRSLLGVIVSLSIALAAREARSQAPDPRALAEVATGLERSVVEVEWHLQEDRGEDPEGWLGTGCPVCDEGGGEYASEVLADDLP
ncbi:MAG TPA: hypothetical protein VK116_10805, partial [Planctomycetota bacterium]|nr:hypothetical protein [Planctomycetota bacterium]